MELETFQRLPTDQVAQLVREAGPKVCVFPINGTRRWFMLEYPPQQREDFASTYLDVITEQHIEVYKLLFDHGLDTLLTPVFGPDIMERGKDYMQMASEGLSRLANHPDFLAFYENLEVRVRFYGDYQKFFDSTPYVHLFDLFDEVTERTRENQRHRLFFGLFAHDATETVAEIAIRIYEETGRRPDRRQIVEAYYGEYVEPVDLFIGFDKFSAFDMPLVATGSEDLYFTVSPSLYLSQQQLRDILYDHLYARRGKEPDYAAMKSEDWTWMREFYRRNRTKTLGLGIKQKHDGLWYPSSQVIELPDSITESRLE